MTSRPSVLPATGAGAVPLLVRLRALRPSLSPAEDRVAEQVLADPRATAALTISELAVAAATSETTVMRFCKRLDLPGYPQLRLALAEESAQPRSLSAARTDISASDTVDDVIRKIAFADSSAVEETAQQLDRATLTETATLIGKAGRVDVYGSGASAVVGADLQMKLHRIGCVAFSWSDPHIALTSAALLGSKDVAIGISHSGTTRETIEAITTAARETALRSGATASRIAALTVVDCLYIDVAQRNLRSARKAVKSTRDAVSSHHVDNDLHY